MPLLGKGAVAIWHDIAAEGRMEFYAWHGREHMPERVAIPGFLRGRRYIAIDADLEFFNLYEADSIATLAGPDYLARLNAPTPWTTSTVKHFRSVARSICPVAFSLGAGGGGLTATFRYDLVETARDEHAAALQSEICRGLLENAHVAGAHFLLADEAASKVDTAERKARDEANTVPAAVFIVEGWGDEAAFAQTVSEAGQRLTASFAGVGSPVRQGIYRLQATALPA